MVSSFSLFLTDISLELIFLLRVVLASVCGALIGFERSRRFKDAGIRTHCVVACGAALLMIVSKYGFADLYVGGEYLYGSKGVDSSRIAAQVVSGVGFLGAGVIFRTGTSIKGLTTAAGIWATSAVGLALGCGMYFVGGAVTALIVVEQFVMHRAHFGKGPYTHQEISLRLWDTPEAKKLLGQFLEQKGRVIHTCSAAKIPEGEINYKLELRVGTPVSAQELQELMERHEEVRGFSL